MNYHALSQIVNKTAMWVKLDEDQHDDLNWSKHFKDYDLLAEECIILEDEFKTDKACLLSLKRLYSSQH